MTTEAGLFTAPLLQAGTYTVTVALTGSSTVSTACSRSIKSTSPAVVRVVGATVSLESGTLRPVVSDAELTIALESTSPS